MMRACQLDLRQYARFPCGCVGVVEGAGVNVVFWRVHRPGPDCRHGLVSSTGKDEAVTTVVPL